MRTTEEIKYHREELRSSIADTRGEVPKETIREQVFVLDRVLGLFDTGKPKNQFEIFALLQEAQNKLKNTDNAPLTRETKNASAAVTIYQWVLKR